MKKIGFLSFGHWTPSPRLAGALGGRLAAPVDRARRRRRGAGRRRRVLPRAPLRAPARLAVPAACGGRRAHADDRDRHGRDRHALREPAVHGRGRRRGRPHRGRPAAARDQPRLAGAGDRRLASLRLRARRRRERCRHGTPSRRGVPRGAQGRGLREAQPAADVPQSARAAARRAAFGRPARSDLVGLQLERHVASGRRNSA